MKSPTMANSDLKIRTKDYALSMIQLFAELPKRTETQILGRQLLRSGTSVGARFYILRIVKTCKFPPGFQSVERFERSPVEYGPRFHGAIEPFDRLLCGCQVTAPPSYFLMTRFLPHPRRLTAIRGTAPWPSH